MNIANMAASWLPSKALSVSGEVAAQKAQPLDITTVLMQVDVTVGQHEGNAKADTQALKDILEYQKEVRDIERTTHRHRRKLSELLALIEQALSTDPEMPEKELAALDKQFQVLYEGFKVDFNRSDELYGGEFRLDATEKLSHYIRNNASNQPTMQQATIAIPEGMLGSLQNLSLMSVKESVEALDVLNELSAGLDFIGLEIRDFNASLAYAEREALGLRNDGPSITEINLIEKTDAIIEAGVGVVDRTQALLQEIQRVLILATAQGLDDEERAVLQETLNGLVGVLDKEVSMFSEQSELGVRFDKQSFLSVYDDLSGYLITDSGHDPEKHMSQLVLPNLSAKSLFGVGVELDIGTVASAVAWLGKLEQASERVRVFAQEIADFKFAMDYAKEGMVSDIMEIMSEHPRPIAMDAYSQTYAQQHGWGADNAFALYMTPHLERLDMSI